MTRCLLIWSGERITLLSGYYVCIETWWEKGVCYLDRSSHCDLLTLFSIAPKSGHTNSGFTHSDSGALGGVGALWYHGHLVHYVTSVHFRPTVNQNWSKS